MDFNQKKKLALEKSILHYNIDFENVSNLEIDKFLSTEKYRLSLFCAQEKDKIKLENYVMREMYNEVDNYIFNPKHHLNKFNDDEYELNTPEDEKVYIGAFFSDKTNKVKKISKKERSDIKLDLLEMYNIDIIYVLFHLFMIENTRWYIFPPKQKFYDWVHDHNHNYLNLTFPEGRIKEKFIPLNFFFVNKINKQCQK
jgi:hypothetical protein